MRKFERTPTDRKPPSPKWLEGKHHSNAPKSQKHEERLSQRLGAKKYAGSGNRLWSHRSPRPYRPRDPERVGFLPTGSKIEVPSWGTTKPQKPDTAKGDFATPKLHLEHKFTTKKSISITLEWLDKVREGAIRYNKLPGLVLTYDRGAVTEPEEWALVPLDVLEKLLRR